MWDTDSFIEILQKFGVGRRSLHDELFSADNVRPRLGIYDEHEEDLWPEVVTSATLTPSAPQSEYRCGHCARALPSPHLLDLHVQETHDSFFAVLAARKPSYCCYIQECTNKFIDAKERMDHCVEVHKLPKDFRFEIKPKGINSKKKSKCQNVAASMDVDDATTSLSEARQFSFHNSKRKSLVEYTGKIFTADKNNKSSSTKNMDEIMSDLKENLPR